MTSQQWSGFTEEDIERIKSNPKVVKSCVNNLCEIDGSKSVTSQFRKPMKIKNTGFNIIKNDVLDDGCEGNSSCFESKSKQNQISSTCDKKYPAEPNSDQNLSLLCHDDLILKNNIECTCSNVMCEQNEIDMQKSGILVNDISEKSNSKRCDEDSQSDSNLPALEVFEMRQKRIEAENARRRALISKAISDKKMQTQAEAVKLAKIAEALNQIDNSFSTDVSILRDYIEKASHEFTEAEKHYRKAEKEYVDAKYVLFQKMQRKEMLTEHLCAIIEQNENRKADKLVELMNQLDMEVIVEDLDVNGVEPILPNLCSLNDELYHSCHTLKPSSTRGHLEEQIQNTKYQEQGKLDVESQKSIEYVCASNDDIDLSSSGTRD